MPNSNYNPTPAKVWSRLQNPITFANGTNFQCEDNMNYKGNVLQYKGNSNRITKKQRYTQVVKGLWVNRKKTFATQNEEYTNPNINYLQRINYSNVPFQQPSLNIYSDISRNVSGPYQYYAPIPVDCPNNVFQDGGNLINGTYQNPCSQTVIQTVDCSNNRYPTTCSDVPGKIQNLYWDARLNSWFPRQRIVMSSSGTKWPQGYTKLVSAVTPVAPILTKSTTTASSITLTWSSNNNTCMPISSYNIYQNNAKILSLPYTTTSITINSISPGTQFYVTALSNTIESLASNIVT